MTYHHLCCCVLAASWVSNRAGDLQSPAISVILRASSSGSRCKGFFRFELVAAGALILEPFIKNQGFALLAFDKRTMGWDC